MPYEVKTWFCGDEDLDEVFAAAREKVTEIVDRNVQAAIDEAFKDIKTCVHLLDTDKHSRAAGEWDVSFSDFEKADGDVHTFRQSINDLVEYIIVDGYIEKIERSHYLFREAWARVFEQAAKRIRAAHGEVIGDRPYEGKYADTYRSVDLAWQTAAEKSGLVNDLLGTTPDKPSDAD